MVLARMTLLPVMVMVGAVALLALACTSEEQPPPGTPGQPLAGTSWTLLSVGGSPAIGNVEVEFSEASGISGWTGCNSYDGRYSASGSSFTIEELRWTEAGCPNRELFTQESLYLDLLVDAEESAVSGPQLTITSSDGQAITFALKQ